MMNSGSRCASDTFNAGRAVTLAGVLLFRKDFSQMSTAAQMKANRENGAKSHGPVTPEGKQASCLNNFRHGLTGHRFFLLERESPEDYEKLVAELENEHNPQTETEKLLVETMAQSRWLSQRANTMQSVRWGLEVSTLNALAEELNRFARYQAQHQRAFYQALNQFLKLREARRKEQIGFESQQRAEAHKSEREQRRQACAEHDELKTEILKQKREREQSHAIIAAMKAGKAMEAHLGPEGAKMMGQMMDKKAA
jgi:hypothetical protein